MKDIPVFSTPNGVASLILREIPSQQTAYVHIQSSLEPKNLVEECAGFCRAIGAERIYATGHEFLEIFPLYTSILQMQCPRDNLEETDAALFPVTEKTAAQWQSIYNEKVKGVPNGAWMTDTERCEMLTQGDGYFVHRNGDLLGIGRVNTEQIRFLAAVKPGAGADVVKALCCAVFSDHVTLEVASTNFKAMNLYERLGFLPCKEISRWYKIF